MLTQIEIDGFKTFKDFKVELAPFQVIVGPNGSGKSNLFDALQLLSRLAEVDDLYLAFQASNDPQKLRGDAHELFTALPGGQSANRIRMAVELLVERKVQDKLGDQAELTETRLRYELEIVLRANQYGMEQFYITHESLRAILEYEDTWWQKYGYASRSNRPTTRANEQKLFLSTTSQISGSAVAEAAATYEPDQPEKLHTPGGVTITLHQDKQGPGRTFAADQVKRTVLSSITNADFSHVFAVREELRSWKFLHLNHEVLRQPSAISAQPFLTSNGGNLPTTLARIRTEDALAFHFISSDILSLVPDILDIDVEKDLASNQYRIRAKSSDQRSFSAQVLSDGTLRLLALATMRNDPQFQGVLCLEEPENGVDPLHLAKMARLLREMATDFSDPQQADTPLRQVLITTHSPLFISQPDVIDSLLLTITPTRVGGKNHPSLRVTRMVPVATPKTLSLLEKNANEDIAVEAYTIDMVRKYLDSGTLEEAQNQLEQARTHLR